VAAPEPAPGGEPKPQEPASAEQTKPDDLKKVEGIGPKVAGLLNGIGIETFTQLAGAEVDQIRAVLRQASLPMIDPSSWPEQASLAAQGKWEELAELQDALKGGRSA
jgi:predicted flap endonuclease-1-like 5' DNA nuclease